MGLFHRTALPVAAMLLATLSFSANVVYSQDASDTLPFPILPPHTFTALTPEQLTAVDPFPDHYPNLPPAEQRQWVEQQLVQVTDPPPSINFCKSAPTCSSSEIIFPPCASSAGSTNRSPSTFATGSVASQSVALPMI